MRVINPFTVILIILIEHSVNSIVVNRNHWDFDDINSLEHLIDAINYDIEEIFHSKGSEKEKIRALMVLMDNYERNWYPKTPYTSQYSKRKDFMKFISKFEHYLVKVGSIKAIRIHDYIKDLENHFHMVNNFITVFADKRNDDYFVKPEKVCTFASAYIPLFGLLHLTERKYDTKIYEIYYELMQIVSSQLNLFRRGFTDCDTELSFRLNLYNYYRHSIVMHIKKYILAAFTTALDNVCTGTIMVNYEQLQEMKHRFVRQAGRYMRATVDALKHTHHYVISCDNHIEYIELEKMIQTIIIKEEKLSINQKCDHNCDINSMDKNDINNDSGCLQYTDCFMVENIDFCELSNKSREYEWFADSINRNVYGDNSNCSGKLVSFKSYFKWGTISTCETCVCNCLAKPRHNQHTITALSLREQTSDILNNMVVVGIKFVKKDFMIHIQIAEGAILPRQYLNVNEISWVPLDNLTYDDSGKDPGYYLLNENNGNRKTRLTLDSDYTHPRIINLDNIIVPDSYVLTGVRFRLEKDANYALGGANNTIQLQIRVTPFDFHHQIMGSLNDSRWIFSHHLNRDELILSEPDNPTKSPHNTQYNSVLHPYIRFQASDRKKDAGQSTVPFFSAQKVSTYTSLGGLGLFHSGNKGYGGFLVFKILELDISQYMHANLDSERKFEPIEGLIIET